MTRMPAVCLTAVPGKKQRAIEVAQEVEHRGFSGIYAASFGDAMGLCQALAQATSTIELATAIQPIYMRVPSELATHAGTIHELSGGRFRLGLGVSHEPALARMGIETGTPLADMRSYVEGLRAAERQAGELPPIVLATLRDKMLDLAVEIADGAMWANGSLSHMAHSLARIPTERRDAGFFVANLVPTVIDDDIDAARAVNRQTMWMYLRLPNYRNYWKAAGYVEEMEAIEAALEQRDRDAVFALMSDRWLDDCTISGPAAQVRERVEAWFDAGVTTPVLVPSSTTGGQFVAFEEVLAAYS
ncbi:MAG: LLM class flavin-dependent oxidoreductase [Acidimicrobiales bacterium]|nr:LLM class flavin-dependent oxidoreductase [Acidimicrobiales bacterium]